MPSRRAVISSPHNLSEFLRSPAVAVSQCWPCLTSAGARRSPQPGPSPARGGSGSFQGLLLPEGLHWETALPRGKRRLVGARGGGGLRGCSDAGRAGGGRETASGALGAVSVPAGAAGIPQPLLEAPGSASAWARARRRAACDARAETCRGWVWGLPSPLRWGSRAGAAPARFAEGGLAVAARFVQSSLRSTRLPLASSAFKFPERLPSLLSTQFKKNKTQAPREAAAGPCLCAGSSVSPNSRPQTKQEAFHSKAARSKAAGGSLHRFMLCNPTFGKFYVNCVQISFEKFLCSSSQSQGWTTRAAGAAPCPVPPRGAGGRNLEIRALSFLLHHLIAA